MTVLPFLTGISFPFFFGLFLYLHHHFFIYFIDLQNLNQFGSIYGGAHELLYVQQVLPLLDLLAVCEGVALGVGLAVDEPPDLA